jgi:cation diffusion facilitator family transporter
MPYSPLRSPILVAIAAALVTLGLKWLAYVWTGSVGLLSEAVESLINLVAACTAWGSLWYAAKPVDPSHTYGHEKIEFFSSGLEGVLILLAACSIAWYAILRLLEPQEIFALDAGLIIVLVAAVINFAAARYLLRKAQQTGSIVLEADGRHLMTDVWTAAAVLVGMGLVRFTGKSWLDPVVAMLMAIYISWTGASLIRRSFDGLMDRSLPESEQSQLRAAVESKLGPNMHYHALRTRRAGSRRFVDFHLLVPGAMTVHQAHEISMEIETAIQAAVAPIEVTVHIEPIEERAAWEDSQLLPLERAAGHDRPPDLYSSS